MIVWTNGPLDPDWEPTREQAAWILGLLAGVFYLAVRAL